MRAKMRRFVFPLLFVTALSFLSAACANTQPLDGREHAFHDDLLDNLAGRWKLTRSIRGRTVENVAEASWVLNHQFLRVHMKDAADPPEYEARVFIGYDNANDRYVAHWLDVFGGRFSETLGYGKRSGNSIEFVFEYPDGPFHNTFTWDPTSRTWTFLMRQKGASGEWTTFAEDHLRRIG
jgi:Protein of unknown function (DUF1579)